VKDIARWKDGAAPILDVGKLSDETGAALLRDNGVWGIDNELKAATKAFGGHPLALGLLASFLKETQFGDVRRRDRIRAYLADKENPQHDHARRVMESYEKEWLAGRPVYQAIMSIVGLFDRPASGDCLRALRKKPAIKGLTDALVDLDEDQWRRALTRLRKVRLLSPLDHSAPDAIDAHPLVREYFGAWFEHTNRSAWCLAHGRLYEHLRDTTNDGLTPTLAALPGHRPWLPGPADTRRRLTTFTKSASPGGGLIGSWNTIPCTYSAPPAATSRRSPCSLRGPTRRQSQP
jgi:hypothetical protein